MVTLHSELGSGKPDGFMAFAGVLEDAKYSSSATCCGWDCLRAGAQNEVERHYCVGSI